MSKCISNHGEFSEHEVTGGVCEFCGAVEVDYDNLRAALVAIQELHKITLGFGVPFRCGHCAHEHPCPTRRLADEALGGDTRG